MNFYHSCSIGAKCPRLIRIPLSPVKVHTVRPWYEYWGAILCTQVVMTGVAAGVYGRYCPREHEGCFLSCWWRTRCVADGARVSGSAHLVDEAAHAGAGRQHDQHVWEEHEVALLFVLHDTRHRSRQTREKSTHNSSQNSTDAHDHEKHQDMCGNTDRGVKHPPTHTHTHTHTFTTHRQTHTHIKQRSMHSCMMAV